MRGKMSGILPHFWGVNGHSLFKMKYNAAKGWHVECIRSKYRSGTKCIVGPEKELQMYIDSIKQKTTLML